MQESFDWRSPTLTERWQETLGWQPDAQQQQQFQHLYEQILAGNRQLNLTRITDPAEFWEKHLWDSLRGVQPWLSPSDPLPFPLPPLANSKLLDIGTGAGFPGLPIAIALPQISCTLLDSTQKKIAFLDRILPDFSLPQVKTVVRRAEQVGRDRQHRNTYTIVTLRAVAPATICAEYAIPCLTLGGIAILYRGQWTVEENQALQGAAQKLGCTVEFVDAFTTPLSQSIRHCLYLHKTEPTPSEFPRAIGVPTRDPLK